MTDEPDKTGEPSLQEHGSAQNDCARWVAEFAAELRRMHEKAQKPSLRQMSMKVPYSHTALSNALRGMGGRLPSQALTLALVRACGADEQAWRARWQHEHARIAAARTESRDRDRGAGQAIPSGPDVPPPLPRRHLGRILLPVLGAALTLVIAGVVFTVTHGVNNSPPTCAHTGTYTSCIQQLANQSQIPKSQTPQQIRNRIAKFSQNPPQSPGPWPFVVYDTIVTPEEIGVLADVTPADIGNDTGLQVRTTPEKTGQQVGTAPLGSVVWADCYVANNYDPPVPPSDDVGAKWLRIHWPTANFPNKKFARSLPTDRFAEYVYAGYTLPFTHNGKIPTCT